MKQFIILLPFFLFSACAQQESPESLMADELEESLFSYIVDPWYPGCIDTVYGGYTASMDYDWKRSEGPQEKALVQQTRHLWTLSFLYEHYPEHPEYLKYAKHGFDFLKEHFWDETFAGFYTSTTKEGLPYPETLNSKRIYGQAFAINGLAQYYKVSKDQEALDLAIKAFSWMEDVVHDKEFGGYIECLNRDGSPEGSEKAERPAIQISPMQGLKEFNSSLHILEAFTELYKVWPDPILRKRLEEMYLIFRDTIIHPDGYLLLYFFPNWKLVPAGEMYEKAGGQGWYTQHITFGHDVETAFLMSEAAHALGMNADAKTRQLSKKLVDHSLENGWDKEKGGFYYQAYKEQEKITIVDGHKAFWVESEGLNALMLMHSLYPDSEVAYYDYFLQMWKYIDTYLIDKEHGGWYNYGLDNFPENEKHKKSHNWKANYHDVRGMVHSINMLRNENNRKH